MAQIDQPAKRGRSLQPKLVRFLRRLGFKEEAKGHGVPEVMGAIARRDAVIRPQQALQGAK